VVALFAKAGWRTIGSDAIVKDLIATDQTVHRALHLRWGDAVFLPEGGGDRKAIASRVFADQDELKWLESLLHPLVRDIWQAAVASAPSANWLVEIPLLFEKRLETLFDLIVCVECPSEVVEARMIQRGYTGEEVEQRRLRQMPLEEKVQRSDRVLSNAGSLEFLELQTLRLIKELED